MYRYDNRVVITLDAGGTNLVFGAMPVSYTHLTLPTTERV